MTIATKAQNAADDLRLQAPRARQRTLAAFEVEHAIRVHLRIARKLARTEPDRVVTTTLCGGYVPNSYRQTAHCDGVTITGTSAREVKVDAYRQMAQRRRQGIGNTLLVRSRLEDQPMGRIEHAE